MAANTRNSGGVDHPDLIRILLVDDSENVRTLFRTILDLEPDLLVVDEAENGRIAIRLAGDLQPDCIVLDWQMPVLDGPAAIPALRAVAPSASIVLFSNRTGPGAEAAAMVAGADRFVEKQGALADLIGTVRSLRAPRLPAT